MAKVEAKVREIERMRADLRIARIRTIQKGKEQLTADQRKKLQELLAEQIRVYSPDRFFSFRFSYGSKITLPVVFRPSNWRWASAASAIGKVFSIRNFNFPEAVQLNRSLARCNSSARSNV